MSASLSRAHRLDDRALAFADADLTTAAVRKPVSSSAMGASARPRLRVGVLVEPHLESLTADAVLQLVGGAFARSGGRGR